MNKKDLKNIFILLPVSIFAFFSNIWVRPANLMEARNFISAREMILNDNFIIPTLNGFLRFEKPPLPTWLTAFMMKITGNITDEFILRIPVALTGVLFIMLLYYFVKLMTDDSFKSFITGFIGCSTFMIIKLGNENSWDMYPYVFAFGAVTFIVSGLKNNKMRYFITAGIFISLSVLSKGPVGIYGLIIPFFISHIYVYGIKNYKTNWKKIILMILISLIISAVWPMIIYQKYPDIFVNVLNKETHTWMNSHTESIIYYSDYFIYMGIWIFFSFMTIIKSWSKERTDDKKFSKFIFVWNILIFILISLIKMKKKRYGLPLFFVSAIGVGNLCFYYYNKLWNELKKSDQILLNIQGWFMALVSFTVPLVLFTKGYLNGNIKAWYIIMLLIIFVPFCYAIVISLFDKNRWTVKLIVLGSGVLMLLINATANWFFDRTFVKKTQNILEYQKIKLLQKDPPAYDIYSDNYEIEDVWRVGKQIKNYDEKEQLPDKFIFFGNVPEKLTNNYRISRKEIYVKDNGILAELSYLEKIIKSEESK